MKNIFAIIISALFSGCRNNTCIPERIVVGANESVLSLRVFTDPVPELEGIPVKADELHNVRFLPDGTRYDSWWKNGLNTGVGTTEDNAPAGFLVRMSWDAEFREEDILSSSQAVAVLGGMWAEFLPEADVPPVFFFNGERMELEVTMAQNVKVSVERASAIAPSESVPVPERLFYGAVEHRVPEISRKGITKGDKMYVYLAADRVLAREMAQKEGEGESPVVITVAARRMAEVGGLPLEKATEYVWIAESVPVDYLSMEVS